MTPIILACAYQAEALYGSAAKKVTVPIGSPWCNCCRIHTHLKMIAEHESMLKELYQACFQSPGMRTEINKKRGRPSERSKEARDKGAKQGNNIWGVEGGCCKPNPIPPHPQQGPGAEPQKNWSFGGL